MKVAFINPKGDLGSLPLFMPLEVVQLATILAEAGHNVRVFDEMHFRVPERKVRTADAICISGTSDTIIEPTPILNERSTDTDALDIVIVPAFEEVTRVWSLILLYIA